MADEVRRLAERSVQATQEIAQVIETVQKETRSAVTLMEQVLATIVGSVDQTSQLVTEAAHATEEQATDARQVLAMVGNMANLTRQIAALGQGERRRRPGDHRGGAEDEPAHPPDVRRRRGAEARRRHGGEGGRVDRPGIAAESGGGRADGCGSRNLAGESEALRVRVETFKS